MLNREVGAKPTRSRRCKEERTSIMSLVITDYWEGEASYDSESEELPVGSIVVWPARDGERCRKVRILVWILVMRIFIGISTVFHFYEKRFFCFIAQFWKMAWFCVIASHWCVHAICCYLKAFSKNLCGKFSVSIHNPMLGYIGSHHFLVMAFLFWSFIHIV